MRIEVNHPNTRKRTGIARGSTNGSGRPRRRTALSQPELERFRRVLLAKRRELVGDISGMSDEARRGGADNASHYFDDCADIASDEHERDLMLELMGSEQETLEEIDAALKRIDEGRFGICEASGRPIGRARLEVQPWTRYCIDAARAREAGEHP